MRLSPPVFGSFENMDELKCTPRTATDGGLAPEQAERLWPGRESGAQCGPLSSIRPNGWRAGCPELADGRFRTAVQEHRLNHQPR